VYILMYTDTINSGLWLLSLNSIHCILSFPSLQGLIRWWNFFFHITATPPYKYNLTHDILIGGDINEDLTKKSNDYRANYINQFINECHLEITFAGNTFVNSAGQPCCEIEYFLYSKSSNRNFSRKFIMYWVMIWNIYC
jgi:hypothetical protein